MKEDSIADERLLAPPYVDHTPPLGIPPDRAGHRENLRIFRTVFPDAHFTVDALVAEGGTVVVRGTLQATHQGRCYGIAPTNKPRRLTGMAIYRVADDQIRSEALPDRP